MTNFDEQIKKTNYSWYRESIELVRQNFPDVFDKVFSLAFEGEERLETLRRIVGGRIDELLD
ncbi:MAG: hypothetical protein FWG65_05015 [Turicibacter sp.]|nr:hypothetical protein [Turicibacter sp.]